MEGYKYGKYKKIELLPITNDEEAFKKPQIRQNFKMFWPHRSPCQSLERTCTQYQKFLKLFFFLEASCLLKVEVFLSLFPIF